jgi:hypothetical protein
VKVGQRTIIGRGVTVENLCTIGSSCKLETESYITAYSTLEDNVFIAPQVSTSNDNFVGRTKERFKHFKGVTVKKGGRVGTGAVILPGKVIGQDARGRGLCGDARRAGGQDSGRRAGQGLERRAEGTAAGEPVTAGGPGPRLRPAPRFAECPGKIRRSECAYSFWT